MNNAATHVNNFVMHTLRKGGQPETWMRLTRLVYQCTISDIFLLKQCTMLRIRVLIITLLEKKNTKILT